MMVRTLERDEIVASNPLRHESGGMIYVQLADDNGDPLPHDLAQQRLRIAHAQACPRDTVCKA